MNNPYAMAGGQMPQQQQQQQKQYDEEVIYQLVQQILNPAVRETALLDLSKCRESVEDLAPIIWNSFGVMAVLLQEIISIYPMLSPPTLTPPMSNRVCNALALLQCVASHPDTRTPFLRGIIYPPTTAIICLYRYIDI